MIAAAAAYSVRPAPSTRDAAAPVSPSMEMVFAAGAMALLLFMPQLGSLGIVALLGASAGYVALRPSALRHALSGNALLLAIPGFALLSALWSSFPPNTLYYGTQFLLTVLTALLLAQPRRPVDVLLGAFVALFVYAVASVALGRSVAWGAVGGTAFSGLNGGKNYLGDTAALGVVAAMATLVHGLRSRRAAWIAASCAALLIDAYALLSARSSGALIGVVVGCGALLGLYALGRVTVLARVLVLLATALVLLVVAVSWDVIAATAMSSFNKDPTLTGRTYLWYRAAFLIKAHPWLGVGYYGFWVQGNPDAEALWAYGRITARSGFNFHNSLIETLVGLGWIGVAVWAPIILACAARLFARYWRDPTLARCFWLAILTYEAVRLPMEAIGHGPFAYTTVLIFAALGHAAAPNRQRRRAAVVVRARIPATTPVLDGYAAMSGGPGPYPDGAR